MRDGEHAPAFDDIASLAGEEADGPDAEAPVDAGAADRGGDRTGGLTCRPARRSSISAWVARQPRPDRRRGSASTCVLTIFPAAHRDRRSRWCSRSSPIRQPRAYSPITAITGLLYTIPSLAAFAILRPIFGLSLITAFIPLTTYTLLILFRNFTAGFYSVPAEILEAAEGMGYTRRERLLRVELPLVGPADHRGHPPGLRHDDRPGDRRRRAR